MNKTELVKRTEQYVRSILEKDTTGHDWFHIHRVRTTSLKIAEVEGGDTFIIELAALLHDVIDDKIVASEEEASKELKQWLLNQGMEAKDMEHIFEIIQNMSFKGGNRPPVRTLEAKIVQDADRLDALGAVGIARTFTYSGAKGQSMYDPNLPPRNEMSYEEYRNGKSTAINHFYEKLLKLKDLMNTDYGLKMAEERHRYMEMFLEQFNEEWNGNR